MRKASFLRKQVDKLKPYVENNKLLHTVFDGFDTFLFAPDETTESRTHIKDGIDLKRTMVYVVLGMVLCALHGIINIGHQHYNSLGLYPNLTDGLMWKAIYGVLQFIPAFVVVHLVGLGIEFFFAAKKGHPIEEGFLVSGFLIPLIMPPDLPLWMLAVSVAFAVIIAKEAFGGTGMNILNIALTARVFVFFAHPTFISGDECWVSPDYNLLHTIAGVKAHTLNMLGLDRVPFEGGWKSLIVDGFTGATPLGLAAKGGWDSVIQNYSISDMILGFIPGSVGEMNKILVLIGAAFLAFSGIASWRIMLGMLFGTIVMGILINIIGGQYQDNLFLQVPWYYHLIMGSFLFAMAFMATDPVTGAQTDPGKWVYGFLIGVSGMIIRVLNPAYPEGWMLAILLLNVFAPLIDHVIVNRNIKRRLARVRQS